MDQKANRNAVISLVGSVLTFIIIVAYLFVTMRSITTAFPGEPLTNPRIYNQSGVVLSLIIVLFMPILGIVGVGWGSDSIRRSRAQSAKPSVLAVIGLLLGLLDQIMIISLLGFHVYLMIQFAGMN